MLELMHPFKDRRDFRLNIHALRSDRRLPTDFSTVYPRANNVILKMTDKNPSNRCPFKDLDAKLPEIWTLQNAIPD